VPSSAHANWGKWRILLDDYLTSTDQIEHSPEGGSLLRATKPLDGLIERTRTCLAYSAAHMVE